MGILRRFWAFISHTDTVASILGWLSSIGFLGWLFAVVGGLMTSLLLWLRGLDPAWWALGGFALFVLVLIAFVHATLYRDRKTTRKTEQNDQLAGTTSTDGTTESLNTIPLVELLNEVENRGWQFTAFNSQQIFSFMDSLRDAGSTKTIQFWGRRVQRIDNMTKEQTLTEIPSNLWQESVISGMSCLDFLDEPDNNIAGDNFQTTITLNTQQEDLYKDIHLNRKQVLNWLRQQTPPEISGSNYDKPVLEVLCYIATGNWRVQTSEEGMLKTLCVAAKNLRQKARDGDIVIYGRDTGYSPSVFDPIPAGFWRSHQIKLMDVFDPTKTNNDIGTEITLIGGRSHVGYKDMHTSKQAIERLWPERT